MGYMTQRFLAEGVGISKTPVTVFDTMTGLTGMIVQVDLDSSAIPTLAPLYTGSYMTVQMADSTKQVFTTEGNKVDHATGVKTAGVVLLTLREVLSAKTQGYPATGV